MHQRHRRAVGLVTAVAVCTAVSAVGVASAATDPASPPTYERVMVDAAIPGSSFSVTEDISGDSRPEIVASGFGTFSFGPFGPIPAAAGTVSVYENTAPNKKGGSLASWAETPVVELSDGITIPSQPTVADVDRDGDKDIVIPAGWFFDGFSNLERGSITWWENREEPRSVKELVAWGKCLLTSGTWDAVAACIADLQTYKRHDVVTNSPFAFHSVQHADMDGDGKADLVTVGEDVGNPQDYLDDVVETLFFKGNGKGGFQPGVKIGDGGGSLIEVHDVNGDGKLDIVSPQYFGPVTGQPFVPPFARDASVASYVWFEQTGSAADGLTQADFTKRAIGTAQGTAFSIKPVKNFRGDGVTRWLATNHTNDNIMFPPFSLYPDPAVFEFTPGADPTQPWAVVKLTADNAFPVTGGVGQAAPGDFHAGDLDGDGDKDLAVSGDGSRTLYWVEQKGDGTFPVHTLPDAAGWGQAGGAVVDDLNRDGVNEMVFGSFDQNALAIWQR